MSTWGQNFLRGFTEVNSLRDYTHASKTFRTNYYELKPRFKFLFHVKFNINNNILGRLVTQKIFSNENIQNLSLAVKTVDLPKYKIDTHVLNQYNRKRVVQTKLNYEPVNISFHDDGGDNIRQLWYQYYSYYYKDPSQQYGNAPVTNGDIGQIQQKQNGFSYPTRDIYSAERVGNVNDWGFIGESYLDVSSTASGKPPFFQDIEIYGFDQHNYARYILVNPIITAWNHDQYDYAQGNGVMQNSMSIAYETVKYYSGKLGKPVDPNAVWPITDHYDTIPSALARPGGTATITGQGGLLDAGQGILSDLERGDITGLVGAAQKAGTLYNTFKGKNLKSVVQSEAVALGRDVINQQVTPTSVRGVLNKADGWVFPVNTGYGNVSRADYNRLIAGGVVPP